MPPVLKAIILSLSFHPFLGPHFWYVEIDRDLRVCALLGSVSFVPGSLVSSSPALPNRKMSHTKCLDDDFQVQSRSTLALDRLEIM